MLFSVPDSGLVVSCRYVYQISTPINIVQKEKKRGDANKPSFRMERTTPRPKLPLHPLRNPLLLPPALLRGPPGRTNTPALPQRRAALLSSLHFALLRHSRRSRPPAVLRRHHTERHALEYVLCVDWLPLYARGSGVCSLGLPAQSVAAHPDLLGPRPRPNFQVRIYHRRHSSPIVVFDRAARGHRVQLPYGTNVSAQP